MTNIAIFGATSAIAEHVARLYAVRKSQFFLVARDAERLERIKQDLLVRGASAVTTRRADLADIDQFRALVAESIGALTAIDIALVAFGTLGDQSACEADLHLTRQQLEVNFISPACLVSELANQMEQRGVGTIGVITSVAGDRGRRSNYIYGAAKGGLTIFLEGLSYRLASRGLRIVDVKPGLIDTPMTAHIPKRGLLWASPETAAKGIQTALDNAKAVAYVPRFWQLIMLIVAALPRFVLKRATF